MSTILTIFDSTLFQKKEKQIPKVILKWMNIKVVKNNSDIAHSAQPSEWRGVYCNNFYFNDYITNKMLIELVQQKKIKPTFKKGVSLTHREKEIAVLICKELSYKEIAEKLSISLRTVESHKTNILEKIGANKVTGLVVFATKKGWI